MFDGGLESQTTCVIPPVRLLLPAIENAGLRSLRITVGSMPFW